MEFDFNTSHTSKIIEKQIRKNEDRNTNRKVLYGTDIYKSYPPTETLYKTEDNLIAFRDSSGLGFALNSEMLSKHLLLLGGIGCGKTNVFNIIIDSLLGRLRDNDVMIIFDTKGDYYEKFRNKIDSSRCWVIGNGEEYRNVSKTWNIFDEMKIKGSFTKESELIAKEVSKQLFKGRESSTQPFFSLAAEDLVAKVLIHLMRKAVKNHSEAELTTEDFVSFLKKASIKQYYEMIMDPVNPEFVSAQFYFGNPEMKLTPQALGVFGYINSMVNDLFIGVFAERSWNEEFSMKRIVKSKHGRVVFVEYDLSVGETLAPIYRTLFDLALKEALGGRDENRGNTYMIIDEFKLLPDLFHIEDALNFGRSLGVKIMAGLQSVNQLFEVYGVERGKVLLSGFTNCFCFKTPDRDSRRFIMERSGETYESHSYTSDTTPVIAQRAGNVVNDWDIENLDKGDAFISLSGFDPFRFHFPLYR